MTERKRNLLKLLRRARKLYAKNNDMKMYVYFAKLSNYYNVEFGGKSNENR